METVKKRETYLDWICGLMILQMIFGHIAECADLDKEGTPWWIAQHILTMFMPWFFFKGGMFFNPKKSLKEITVSSWQRLMVPFIVYSIIGYAVFVVLLFVFRPEANWHYYVGGLVKFFHDGFFLCNSPLWFLLSLFIVRTGYRWAVDRKAPTWLILSVSAAIPMALHYTGFSWFLLGHTSLGMFFFVCGFKLKDSQFGRQTFIASAVLTLAVLLLKPSYVEMFGHNLVYGSYLVYFVYSVASVVLINNLCKITPPDC